MAYDENILSDLYKDAHGFRPGPGFFQMWDDSTEEEKNRIWDDLVEDVEQAVDDDLAREIAAIIDYEAKISEVEALGQTRETAIRWIVESLGSVQDGGEVCWSLGLPFRMESEFAPYVKPWPED